MSTRDILVAARAKIERPECWVQKAYTKYDDRLVPIAWCMIGAICEAEAEQSVKFSGALDLLESICCGPASRFNDKHTHAEVLDAMDRAIAAAGDA